MTPGSPHRDAATGHTARRDFDRSYMGGRVTLVGVVSTLGHLSAGMRASRRSKLWLAPMVGSILYDLHFTHRLRDPKRWPGIGDWIGRAADTALWSFADDGSNEINGIVALSNVIPMAVTSAFRATAGTAALPVADPRRPFPPASLAKAARTCGEVALSAFGPFATLSALQHRRGRRVPWELSLAGALAAATAMSGARQRHRLQLAASDLWSERTASLVDREFSAATAEHASRSTKGHDFKKTLLALGFLGSSDAMAAARAAAAQPGMVADKTAGTTVFGATRLANIDPPAAAVRWLTPDQAERVADFLDEAVDQAEDGLDQTLHVDVPDPWTTRLTWLGHSLELSTPPPPLVANLNPTAPGFIVGAGFVSTSLAPQWRVLPPAVSAIGIAVQLLLAKRYWRTPPEGEQLERALYAASVVPIVALVATAVVRPPAECDGMPHFAMTPFCEGMMLEVAANWGCLEPRTRAILLGGTVAAWLAGSLLQGHQSPLELLVEAAVPAMTLTAWRASDRTEFEASFLEHELQARYTEQVLDARDRATAAQLANHVQDLLLAERECTTLASDPVVDRELLQALEADCVDMRAWLQSNGAL